MTATVLVLNSGSSSLKYQLVQPDTGESVFDGIVERIGEDSSTAKLNIGAEKILRDGRVPDHEAGLAVDEIEAMLNRRSGLFGLCGDGDLREVQRRIAEGDGLALEAYQVYIHRLRKYVGAYLAVLEHTDVITFTAGVGENDAKVRRDALSGLASLAIELDEHLNDSSSRAPRRISADSSPTTVLVIPTNEELAIARASVDAL